MAIFENCRSLLPDSDRSRTSLMTASENRWFLQVTIVGELVRMMHLVPSFQVR